MGKKDFWPKEGKLKKGLIILAIVISGALLITLIEEKTNIKATLLSINQQNVTFIDEEGKTRDISTNSKLLKLKTEYILFGTYSLIENQFKLNARTNGDEKKT